MLFTVMKDIEFYNLTYLLIIWLLLLYNGNFKCIEFFFTVTVVYYFQLGCINI